MDYIAGICYRDNNGNIIDGGAVVVENMAQLPFAYQQEEMADIKERILYYETSRGCPFACAYCLSCATKGVRYRPMDMVLQELQFFVDNDVRQVKFVDRTFNAKKSHYMPILEFIKNLPENCRTNFHFEMAIDYLDSEELINVYIFTFDKILFDFLVQISLFIDSIISFAIIIVSSLLS